MRAIGSGPCDQVHGGQHVTHASGARGFDPPSLGQHSPVAKRLFLCAKFEHVPVKRHRYCEHSNSAGHSIKFGGEGFHTRVSHLHAAEIHCVLRPCELSITSLGLCKKQIHFVLETCSSFHSRTKKIDVESPRLSSMVRNISNIARRCSAHGSRRPFALSIGSIKFYQALSQLFDCAAHSVIAHSRTLRHRHAPSQPP